MITLPYNASQRRPDGRRPVDQPAVAAIASPPGAVAGETEVDGRQWARPDRSGQRLGPDWADLVYSARLASEPFPTILRHVSNPCLDRIPGFDLDRE